MEKLAMRSLIAKSLADPKYRQKIVTPRKGRGSYTRKTVKVKYDR